MRKIIFLSVFTAILMFGMTFAIVPVYRSICLLTGLSVATIDPSIQPDFQRDITVQFVATNNAALPWEFHPQQTSIHAHPNETLRVAFFAKNNSDKAMTVQAIPSYAPAKAGQHFHKIECFCFRQQTLKAHESKVMPIVFRLDKKLPDDVKVITLAYTLFDVTRN